MDMSIDILLLAAAFKRNGISSDDMLTKIYMGWFNLTTKINPKYLSEDWFTKTIVVNSDVARHMMYILPTLITQGYSFNRFAEQIRAAWILADVTIVATGATGASASNVQTGATGATIPVKKYQKLYGAVLKGGSLGEHGYFDVRNINCLEREKWLNAACAAYGAEFVQEKLYFLGKISNNATTPLFKEDYEWLTTHYKLERYVDDRDHK